MASLYELTVQAEQLLEMLENGDIDERVYNDTLEAMGIDEKIENCCKMIKQLTADAEMYKSEIDRLTLKKKTAENSIKRLKESILNCMQSTNQNKIKTAMFSVSTRTSNSVEIINTEEVPKEFKIPQPDKIDKSTIRKALSAGEAIPGVALVESVGVQIR